MKKILFYLFVFVMFSFSAIAQESGTVTTSNGGPKLKLAQEEVDYGTIQKGGDPFRTVKFTNVGTEDLIIKNATGNCGCTVPTYPREAIKPGETNEIKIRYATDRVGQINKKVTLVTNEVTDNTHVINVKGNVLAEEEKKGVPESTPNMLSPKK